MNRLFDVQTTPGTQKAELDALLRGSLRRAVTISPLSPAQIADDLTKRLQRPVNEGLIYAWMAPTNRNRIPADAVPHLCKILGDDSIQRLLLSEKMRQSLELGESAPRVVSLLRSALDNATERKNGKAQNKPKWAKQ